MKKKLVLTLLGLAATAVSSYGQGGIVFNNGPAGGPYVPIVWGSQPAAGHVAGDGLRSTDGVAVTLWFGLDGGPLSAGPQVVWNSGFEASGYYGYYTVQATLNSWVAGQTWDFQLVATGPGGISGQSAVWTENANIAFIGGIPPGPPGNSVNRIGFTVNVPEPSTFALLGLGALALVNYRRRNA